MNWKFNAKNTSLFVNAWYRSYREWFIHVGFIKKKKLTYQNVMANFFGGSWQTSLWWLMPDFSDHLASLKLNPAPSQSTASSHSFLSAASTSQNPINWWIKKSPCPIFFPQRPAWYFMTLNSVSCLNAIPNKTLIAPLIKSLWNYQFSCLRFYQYWF